MVKMVNSYWHPEPVAPTERPLDSNIRADVVVIGGGISGLSCAYYLQQAGADVVLLDRGAIGAQASTRNFGVLTSAWDYGKVALEQRRARARFGRATLPAIKSLIEREGIDCDFRENRNWQVARHARDVAGAKALADDLQSLGYDAHFTPPGAIEVTRRPLPGATYYRAASVDPYRLVVGLKQALLRHGVRIFEGSPVQHIEDGASASAITAHGSVQADQAVVTVNGAVDALGLHTLRGAMLPAQVYALATRPLSDSVAEQIGPRDSEAATDLGRSADLDRYWQRFLPNGRLLFGGGAPRLVSQDGLFTHAVGPHKAASLVRELKRRYPVLSEADVDLYWGGTLTGPVGERPVVAPVPGMSSVIVATVCMGRGMLIGSSAGRLVQELLSPGALDADGRAFLDYCAIPNDAMSRLEGTVYKLLKIGLVRRLVNRSTRNT